MILVFHVLTTVARFLRPGGRSAIIGYGSFRSNDGQTPIIDHSGYWEYFDPRDGQGCGGPDFSWTAAIALYWLLD